MADITIKQGDNAPTFLLALERDGVPLELAGATVTARFGTDPPVEAPVEVYDPAAGRVLLDWPAGVLDRAGLLRVVFVAVWPDGRRVTAPAAGFLYVRVSSTVEVV